MPVAHHDTVRDVWLTHDSVLGNAAEPFVLEDWLRDIGVTPSKLATTARQLRDNDFDDRNLLRKVTHEELKECGIVSVGIRKCIVEAVRGTPVTPGGDDRSSMSVLCTSRTDVSREVARVSRFPSVVAQCSAGVSATTPRHVVCCVLSRCRARFPLRLSVAEWHRLAMWRSTCDCMSLGSVCIATRAAITVVLRASEWDLLTCECTVGGGWSPCAWRCRVWAYVVVERWQRLCV
jgi:hypothetical protein